MCCAVVVRSTAQNKTNIGLTVWCGKQTKVSCLKSWVKWSLQQSLVWTVTFSVTRQQGVYMCMCLCLEKTYSVTTWWDCRPSVCSGEFKVCRFTRQGSHEWTIFRNDQKRWPNYVCVCEWRHTVNNIYIKYWKVKNINR